MRPKSGRKQNGYDWIEKGGVGQEDDKNFKDGNGNALLPLLSQGPRENRKPKTNGKNSESIAGETKRPSSQRLEKKRGKITKNSAKTSPHDGKTRENHQTKADQSGKERRRDAIKRAVSKLKGRGSSSG